MFNADSSNKKINGETISDGVSSSLPFKNAYSAKKIKTVYISYLEGCKETTIFGFIQQTTFVAAPISSDKV